MNMKNTFTPSGYALLELVMASFIFGFVLFIGNMFWQYTSRNYDFSMTQYQLTENASRAVTLLAHELKEAQDAMDGAYPLATVLDDEIVFFADVDYDGMVERVHYWILNGNLQRGLVEPSGNPPQYTVSTEKSKIIAENIATNYTPIFKYYNGDWPGDMVHNPLPATNRALETRMIEIRLPISIVDTIGIHTYIEQTTVQMRNLKDNL
jgi:hypothetical protein